MATRDISCTLYFNANGGSGAPSSQSRSVYEVPSTSGYTIYINISSSVIPTRANYDFIGWAKSSSATVADKQPGGSYAFYFSPSTSYQSLSATLYAVWKLKTYTVNYVANGGNGAPESQVKTHGTDLTLSSTIPTRINYVFQGWSTSANGSAEYSAGGSYTVDADVNLYAVWKVAAATLNSVSDVDIGGTGLASWTKVSESHTYKLTLHMPNSTYIVVDIAAGWSYYYFDIPDSWYNALPSSVSGIADAVLATYDNGVLIGETSKTFTVSVPSNIKPTISSVAATPHSSNSVIENWGVVVQGYSYVTINVNASAGAGASITSVYISGHGINQNSTDLSGNTAIITNVGTITYNVVVTDSRGRKSNYSVSITSYEYVNPVISDLRAVRCLQDGTVSDVEGDYIKAISSFSISSVNSLNSITTKKIEYKLHIASSWTLVTSSPVSGSWTSVFGVADITKTYDVRCVITDAIGNSAVLVIIVPPVVGFAIGLKNDRARFGGPVEKEGLQVDWNSEFNGYVDVTKRRAYSSITSGGWCRVCKIKFYTEGQAKGAAGGILHFDISSTYGTNSNDAHSIDLLLAYNNVVFLNEVSSGSYLNVNKIRYTYDSESFEGFVDVYCSNGNYALGVAYYCSTVSLDRQADISSENLISVDASPVGEIVFAEYSFGNVASNITSIGFRKYEACGNIESGRSIDVSYLIAKVFVFRASSSLTPVVALCDQWGGITYISQNDNIATISASNGVLTIRNTSSTYIDYIIEKYTS